MRQRDEGVGALSGHEHQRGPVLRGRQGAAQRRHRVDGAAIHRLDHVAGTQAGRRRGARGIDVRDDEARGVARQLELTGKLAPDAEILINGSTARLEDVQTEDQVEVTGRVEKRGDEQQLVATKVQITRLDAGTASAPAASQPGK